LYRPEDLRHRLLRALSQPIATEANNLLTFIPGTYRNFPDVTDPWSATLTIIGTPEPATLTFLFAGLGALGIRKRLARRD
jgi:hypothetical protein